MPLATTRIANDECQHLPYSQDDAILRSRASGAECHDQFPPELLVLLRPGRFGLLVHTLFYADEVRGLDEFRTESEWVAPQELELATG